MLQLPVYKKNITATIIQNAQFYIKKKYGNNNISCHASIFNVTPPKAN